MDTKIIGYSLLHYAIVSVPSKSKKGTKKAKEAAIEVVRSKSRHRVILDAVFTNGTGQDEIWVVTYVRPSDPLSGGNSPHELQPD